jgi:hypothetical protein
VAGTRVIRTTNASTRTPTPSPKAIVLSVASWVPTKLAKTENMISAAAVTIRVAFRRPRTTAADGSLVSRYASRMLETMKTS